MIVPHITGIRRKNLKLWCSIVFFSDQSLWSHRDANLEGIQLEGSVRDRGLIWYELFVCLMFLNVGNGANGAN